MVTYLSVILSSIYLACTSIAYVAIVGGERKWLHLVNFFLSLGFLVIFIVRYYLASSIHPNHVILESLLALLMINQGTCALTSLLRSEFRKSARMEEGKIRSFLEGKNEFTELQ